MYLLLSPQRQFLNHPVQEIDTLTRSARTPSTLTPSATPCTPCSGWSSTMRIQRYIEWLFRIQNRKWRATKQQPILLPGPAVLGCFLVSFHFLSYIHHSRTVLHEHFSHEWKMAGLSHLQCLSGLLDIIIMDIQWWLDIVTIRYCYKLQLEQSAIDPQIL